MRVLCCGDRHWINKSLIRRAILEYTNASWDTVIIHGCATGADSISGQIGREYDLLVVEFPANWNKYGRTAGPIRNKQMLDEGKPDLVLAFHTDIKNSKGTKNMIQQAEKRGIKVILIKE